MNLLSWIFFNWIFFKYITRQTIINYFCWLWKVNASFNPFFPHIFPVPVWPSDPFTVFHLHCKDSTDTLSMCSHDIWMKDLVSALQMLLLAFAIWMLGHVLTNHLGLLLHFWLCLQMFEHYVDRTCGTVCKI